MEFPQTQLSVVTGNKSVPIQLAQCWFPGLAISNNNNNNNDRLTAFDAGQPG